MKQQAAANNSQHSLDARGRGTAWSILLVQRQLRLLPTGRTLEVAYDNPNLPRELGKILIKRGYQLSATRQNREFGLLRICCTAIEDNRESKRPHQGVNPGASE